MTSHETDPQRIEAERLIPASPETIFSVLCSPEGHVAIDSTGMLMWAEGRPASGVGDTFVIHMDRDSLRDVPLQLYDVTVSVTRFEASRAIEWTILSDFLDPPIGHVYGYRLDAVEDGTSVTSYCDWSRVADVYRGRVTFPIVSELALRATLGILARTVAPGVPRPMDHR
jgi:hypothetical protein